MDNIATYNPLLVKVAFGNHIVTGYAEDSFVTIEPLDSGITSKAGCDGDIVRSVDPNNRYTVKVALLVSSPTNRYLSDQYAKDKRDGSGAFPVLIKDVTGAEKFTTSLAWVTKQASVTKGKEGQNKEWVLETGQAELAYK